MEKLNLPIEHVVKGDIVRFASFSLRVDIEPKHKGNRTILWGRISTGGCPTVTRSYINGLTVRVERG